MEKLPSIKELLKQLGKDYRITHIDWEKVLYRNFGNGFNVEISGVSRANRRKPATIYLWFGETAPTCLIVKTVRDVGRSAAAIDSAVESLFEYSEELIAAGYTDRNRLFKLINNM